MGSPSRKETCFQGALLGSSARGVQRRPDPVDPDHLPRRANKVRREKGDIPRAASDVENPHPRTDAGPFEEAPGHRVHKLGLTGEALELLLGVP